MREKKMNSNTQLSYSKEEILWKKNGETLIMHNYSDSSFWHQKIWNLKKHNKYHRFTPLSFNFILQYLASFLLFYLVIIWMLWLHSHNLTTHPHYISTQRNNNCKVHRVEWTDSINGGLSLNLMIKIPPVVLKISSADVWTAEE